MSDESESLSASSTTTTTSSSGVIMTTAMPTTQAPSTPISSVSPTDGYEVPNGHLSPTDLANGMMGGGEPAGHMYVPPGAPHGMQNPRPTQRSHSPVRYSPNGQSRGNSPQGQGMQSHSPPGLQHVVHVHVNPGETFSVRVGDQIQHIQGPATVRMVSNNGPPLPMPMQVPPGHMVQQIVDENGILTHVILSPQPPGMPGPPLTGGPNGSQQMYGYGGPQYATFPQHQFPAHHHHPHTGAPTHIHPMPQPHIQSTTPCSNHGHHVHTQGPAPHHHNHIHDERTQRQHDRLRSKLQQRQEKGHYTSRSRHTKGKMNGDVKRPDTTNSSSSSADGQDMEEEKTQEERKIIWELLSKMQSPKVSDVESRSALIELIPPELDQADYNIDPSEYQYELLLSDKGKEGKYKLVYSGDATQITLKDLKPATEYFLKVCSQLEDLKGEQTEYVSFKTDACEPDRPQPPKLSHKQKSSLQLKWNATPDNGSKISCYTLEYDEGRGDGKFSEIYNGLPRQYKVTKLIPATGYTFRLAAVNAIGKSEFSEPVCFYTSGSVPTQPEPPQLIRQGVVELALHWTKRPNDEDFTLQMEDEATGHGYLTVYNGPDLRHTVKPLKRNTEYRFRLSAKNEEGSSKPSEPVCYCTLPDRPAAPHRPQLKGKPHTHSFRLTWDAPWDTGGSDITGYRLELDEGRGFELVYSGIDQDYTCDHLIPGHTYRVRVSCNSAGGPSEWSEPLAVTTQAVEPGHCAPPKLHGKPKAMSLQLKWNYPDYDGGSNVTEFRIQMTLPDNTTREVYRGPDLVCTVAGLSPGRPYLFQVRAGNKAGVGPWSDILDVISGPGVPDPPKCPQTHCRSAHCVLVSWDEPVNNGATITEYRLEWQAKPDSEFTQLYCGSGLNHEIRGLQPASLYSFRVQALNSAGAGPFSELANCTTPPSSPAAVTSVRASATADTISLMWKPPPDNGSEILSYNIDLGEKTLLTVGNLHEFVIENLLPETTYKIRVQAVNGIGVGAFSTPVKVTTRSLPPSPPSLECVNCGPNSLKLKWGDGKNPDMVQYVLEMLRENGSFHTVYHGHGHSHKVNKLSELTTYQFRIYAANAAGDGPHSDVFIFTTTKAPPPAVKPPRVVEVTLDSCQLEWTPLKPMGKDLLTYTLQLAHSRDAEYKKVYHGPSTSHKLTGLCAKSTYQVRVCATRVCADGSQDLTGANSPGVEFTTHAPKPLVYSQPTSAIQSKMEPKQWTDHQWACIILSGFAIFAIVIAFLAQQLISYTSNSSSSSQ